MKTKSFSNRTVQIAFGSAIAILLIVGAVSYHSIVVSRDRDKWVQHSHAVLSNLQDLRIAMVTISASIRGFALTGKESYLEPYHAIIPSMKQNEAALRNLTVDNPVQQRQMPILEKLEAEKIERAEMIISLHRTKGSEAAADAVRSGSGLEITSEFQAVVRQIQDEEQRLLEQRTSAAKRSLRESRMVLLFGTLLGLLITAAAGWIVQRDSARRGIAEQAFRDGEEKYRTLLYEVQEYAVFTLDTQGRVLTWNAGAERIKGYSADQIIGRDFSCFFVPDDVKRGRPQELLRLTAASGRHEEQCTRVRQEAIRIPP
ncbi:MAG: CHASE3 domain-containing protein [Stellaceae bacterium]